MTLMRGGRLAGRMIPADPAAMADPLGLVDPAGSGGEPE